MCSTPFGQIIAPRDAPRCSTQWRCAQRLSASQIIAPAAILGTFQSTPPAEARGDIPLGEWTSTVVEWPDLPGRGNRQRLSVRWQNPIRPSLPSQSESPAPTGSPRSRFEPAVRTPGGPVARHPQLWGRKPALRREIPSILRGFQGRLSCRFVVYFKRAEFWHRTGSDRRRSRRAYRRCHSTRAGALPIRGCRSHRGLR